MLPHKIIKNLHLREQTDSYMRLGQSTGLIDFYSNDYLGLANNVSLFKEAHQYLVSNNCCVNGATGSRLLSGNFSVYTTLEAELKTFYNSEAALVFNSGYVANLGFFASVPQRGDIVLYDEYVHASIRDGIQLSPAKGYKFKHNDLQDLSEVLKRHQLQDTTSVVYVVTESVFSMDGDIAPLKEIALFCNKEGAFLVVDEAHAVGVYGNKGSGLVTALAIEQFIFARIVTFGKAIGSHGACVLGSAILKDYLINFSRPFIYTTGITPHAIASILLAHRFLESAQVINYLRVLISFFTTEIQRVNLGQYFIPSTSAIQCCVLNNISIVKRIEKQLIQNQFLVKAILSPTVPKGQERLRFCVHAFNTKHQITQLLELLASTIKHKV